MSAISSLSKGSLSSLIASASVGAFGDSVGAELDPIVNIKAAYGITDDVQTFSATGGSVTSSNSEFVASSGTSSGGYGTVWSRKPMAYVSGVGAEARITARFTTGIANSTQLAGLFSAADGMFFGYDGADFGLMHRYGGEFEIRSLQITAAASGAETVTITLNGAAYNASVTAGTVNQNAHEIEVALNATAAADSWYIQHIDDSIVFVFRGIGEKAGTYSISSTGTCDGSFTRDNPGANPTEDWTPREQWNKSQATWLDPTKGNLYRVEFAYLGYGPLNYYVMHPTTKSWELVHQIDWPNNKTGTNFGNPSMRVGWASASLGSTGTDLVVRGGSAMSALQGRTNVGRSFAAVGVNTSVSSETQILSIEVRREFGNKFCNAVVAPLINVATDSAKGMIFRVYLNPTVSGVTDHQYIDETESACLFDTAGTTVSGGRFLGAYVVGPNGTKDITAKGLGTVLNSGDELVVTGEVTTGASAGGYVTINTREIL